MKVAYILPSLENRGPVIFTQYLINSISVFCEEVEVFYFKKYPDENCISLGVRCTQINFFCKYDFSKFDIVHTTCAQPDLYGALFVSKTKWVVSMHNYFIDDIKMQGRRGKGFIVLLLWKYALRKCQNVIVSSNAMLEYYRNIIGNKKYAVIPYGICKKVYEEKLIKEQDRIEEFHKRGLFVLGSVGLFIRRKGFHQLIEQLRDNLQLGLVLIGDGPERMTYERMISRYNLEDRVCMPGFIKNSYNYYKYFNAYAHVSYSEGFGLAMLEALSHGLPLLCTRLDIYSEFFSDNDVVYFNADDHNSLASAIMKIIACNNLYSVKSYEKFLDSFSDVAMAKSHVRFYQECR